MKQFQIKNERDASSRKDCDWKVFVNAENSCLLALQCGVNGCSWSEQSAGRVNVARAQNDSVQCHGGNEDHLVMLHNSTLLQVQLGQRKSNQKYTNFFFNDNVRL